MDKNIRVEMLEIEKFSLQKNKKILVNKFINSNDVNKYIMGISSDGYAKELSTIIDINGFIDDFINIKSFLNKPIVKTKNIESNSLIIVCSTVRTRTAVNMLKEKGFNNVISYPEFFKYSKNSNLKLKIINNFTEEYSENTQKYDYIYNRLIDPLSKDTFISLLNYRLTVNLKYVRNFKFDPIGQYFEDFLDLKEGEVFIDAGGYDGQTSIEFIKHCPKYKSIYIFEPDSENIKLAKNNLKNFKNVSCISKGLSNQKDTLKFDTGSGSASSISESGTIEIEVDTLDNLVDEKVSFIKMDIEGAEGLAIEGMRNHILNDYPKMAISVYHKVDDLWKIPEQIFAIRDDYDIYMRHYTEGTDETVMFFMPRKKTNSVKNFYLQYLNEYKRVLSKGIAAENSIFEISNLNQSTLAKVVKIRDDIKELHDGKLSLYHDTKSIYLDNIEKYEYLFNLLDDTYSKKKYIQYYTYQTLNSKLYRVPFDIEYFREKQEEAKELIVNIDNYKTLDIGLINIFNLKNLGFDCKVWMNSVGVVLDFILEQYRYENLVKVEKNDIVIDCGGAIGDTAIYFAVNECSKVYVYEFIPSSLKIINEQIELNPTFKDNIELIEYAVWKESDIELSYIDQGNSSRVGKKGLYVNSVMTLSIDDLVKRNNIKKVDIIKMDIEGAEYEALLGASQTIKKYKPKLMISVYHKKDDLYTIPELIEDILEGYSFYFDYYTDIGWEAILYAVHKA